MASICEDVLLHYLEIRGKETLPFSWENLFQSVDKWSSFGRNSFHSSVICRHQTLDLACLSSLVSKCSSQRKQEFSSLSIWPSGTTSSRRRSFSSLSNQIHYRLSQGICLSLSLALPTILYLFLTTAMILVRSGLVRMVLLDGKKRTVKSIWIQHHPSVRQQRKHKIYRRKISWSLIWISRIFCLSVSSNVSSWFQCDLLFSVLMCSIVTCWIRTFIGHRSLSSTCLVERSKTISRRWKLFASSSFPRWIKVRKKSLWNIRDESLLVFYVFLSLDNLDGARHKEEEEARMEKIFVYEWIVDSIFRSNQRVESRSSNYLSGVHNGNWKKISMLLWNALPTSCSGVRNQHCFRSCPA